MGGKKTNGKKVHSASAQAVAVKMFGEIMGNTLSKRWIAGSVRRSVEMVGDLDLVVVPSNLTELQANLTAHGFTGGEKKMVGVVDGVQVDVYIATDKDFGAQLLMWTGPASFNIRMRAIAKRKRCKLNQYGLFDEEGRCLASEYEGDIFSALMMEETPAFRRM